MASESKGKTPGSAVDKTVLFLAARVLKAAGFNAETTAEIIKKVYGVEVPPETVRLWFGTVRVKSSRLLTEFIQRLASEKLPALAYVSGAIMGDGDSQGRLRVKDWGFIEAYVAALASLTGRRLEVRTTDEGLLHAGCYTFARFIKAGLWRIIAWLRPIEFLSGLLDADGSISPQINRRDKTVALQLNFGSMNFELASVVRDTLRNLGIPARLHEKWLSPHDIKGWRVSYDKPYYVVYSYVPYSRLNVLKGLFNCEKKRKCLEFFLTIKDLPPRQRYIKFTEKWKKSRGRWHLVDDDELFDKYPQRNIKRRTKHRRQAQR